MKTNFTIGKLFLATLSVVALTLSSCSKDETPAFDISGEYTLQSAQLVDGNVNDTDAASNLLIYDGLYLIGSQGDVNIPAGETTVTSTFVNLILSGAAPCTDVNPANWRYKINLGATGSVAFVCTSEGDISETLGTYTVLDNNTRLSISISVSFSPLPITIVISDLVKNADGSLSGTIEQFPMLRYGFYDLATQELMPIGAPIDKDPNNLTPDNLNVQYMSANVTLAKVN